jgi:ATP-dependent helicase/nuclease subunit B
MRRRVGLPSPETLIGQAAHDFAAAACSAPVAILSCPRSRDGAPAVPARWLIRLEAFLRAPLPRHPAAAWAARLDQPAGAARPVAAPRPCPDLSLRPRRLSVTEIETWLADPYAIYAKHVLRLRALKPLEEATDAADYGSLVHDGLHRFLKKHGAAWPGEARTEMVNAFDEALRETRLRVALQEWWRPRLIRIAEWVVEQETARRQAAAPVAIAAEQAGEWNPRSDFLLRGRADRIERRPDGSLAILDYKTGIPPSQKDVDSGRHPQLPLEAAMAEAGAFGAALRGRVAELTYWHLTGGFDRGAARPLFKGDAAQTEAAAAEAARQLVRLIAAFDDPAQPYLSRPHPGRAPRFSDYDQLARVAEWGAGGDEA